MALLDTTVFMDLNGRGGAKRTVEAENVVRRLLAAGELLVASRINIAELYVGAELSDESIAEYEAIDDFLAWITVLELDDTAARSFGRVRAELQRRGALIGDLDTLIASIALAHNHSVVTRNVDHFARVPGLRVVAY